MYVCVHACMYIFFPMALQPQWARPSTLLRLHDNTRTHHIQLNSSSGRVISPTPRPDNTQHSQETDILAHGGIRTLNRSRREAVDPCLRPRGHSWICCLHIYIYTHMYICVFLTNLRFITFTVLRTRKQKSWKGRSINTDRIFVTPVLDL